MYVTPSEWDLIAETVFLYDFLHKREESKNDKSANKTVGRLVNFEGAFQSDADRNVQTHVSIFHIWVFLNTFGHDHHSCDKLGCIS